MTDTLVTTLSSKYTPGTSSNIVENPVYYTYTSAPTQITKNFLNVETETAYTVALTQFETATQQVFVQNLDATNTLSLGFRPSGSSTTCTLTLQPGGMFKFDGALNLTFGIVLQANVADLQAYYYVAGT